MHTVAFTDPVTGKETGFATPGYDGNADTFGQAIHAAMKAAWYGRPSERSEATVYRSDIEVCRFNTHGIMTWSEYSPLTIEAMDAMMAARAILEEQRLEEETGGEERGMKNDTFATP
jgi:hypothetical protein